MKRRDFIKTGLMTAGGLLIPDKASGLEVLANGKIIDTLSEQPVENAKLKFLSYPNNELLKECVTSSSGEYSTVPTGVGYDKWIDVKKLFNDAPEFDKLRKIALEKRIAKRASNGFLKVEINHNNYFDAGRYADLSKNEFNTDIIPKTFDMELFDMWCRSINGQTQRWATEEEHPNGGQPNFFIKTALATKEMIDMVYDIIGNDLVEFTKRVGKGSFINNPHIENGEKIPDYAKYPAEKWILVGWHNDPGFYSSVETDNNRIYRAVAVLSTYFLDRSGYLEELTQILGPLSETETRYFIDSNGYYDKNGLELGKVLYSRLIGSKNQDEDPSPF